MAFILLHLRLGLVGLHLVFAAIQVALLFPFLRNAGRDRLKRRWSRQLLSLLGIELVVPAAAFERLNTGLLIANHISLVDIFAINAALPSGFVAKDDVAAWPLIGWLARHNDTVFLKRGSRRAAHDAQIQIRSALAAGRRLAIFPEGTTTRGDRVLPFHAALFQAAIDAAVPVHAIGVRYVDSLGKPATAPAYVDDINLLDCLRAILRAEGLQVHLVPAASSMPPHQDRRHLARHCHRSVAAALYHRPEATVPQPFGNEAAISA